MLFPADFWLYFTLIVAGGMVATIGAAAISYGLQSGERPRRRATGRAADRAADQADARTATPAPARLARLDREASDQGRLPAEAEGLAAASR